MDGTSSFKKLNIMVNNRNTNPPDRKQDFIYVAILLAIAAGIGIYLIATTVLIAKDGVFYIEQAQKLSSKSIDVIQKHPPGYPFLIFVAYKLISFFSGSSSTYTWIYSAQSVTLLCRLLSLIPLYFIGKMLVGGRKSFWAILILIFLPHFAEFGSDALRDWPHFFFLAFGFWAILWGAKNRNCCWSFGLAGLCAGLGYVIRPECAQLIIYGMIWLGYCFLRPAVTTARKRTTLALIMIVLGFLLPAGPYTKARGAVLPTKIRGLINAFSVEEQSYKSNELNRCLEEQLPTKYMAENSNVSFDALYNIYKDIGESLIWIFMLPWFIGAFHYFRYSDAKKEKFLMSLFIAVNITLLFLRSTNFDRAMSKRYVLPILALTIFYVATGLELLSHKILNQRWNSRISNSQKRAWFYALVVIGLCICMPKLFRPIGADKDGYLKAANWLKENTCKKDIVAVPDKRIGFYADRKRAEKPEKSARYVVKNLENGEETPAGITEVWSTYLNKKKKNKVVIYQKI